MTQIGEVLSQMDEVDDFKREQVREEQEEGAFNPIDANKQQHDFRNYKDSARQARVEAVYKEQHEKQTVEFVQAMHREYNQLNKCKMTMWETLLYLNGFVDDSDPDTNLSQMAHALQTAEAIRKDYPTEDWFQVVGLIHDLGKLLGITDPDLGLVGLPQWAVVGDTFPVGCKFDESIVFHKHFEGNPDNSDERYNSKYGMYAPNCGLENVLFSWGHDEYIYQVCVRNKSSIPKEGLYMLRFHSFYPWHRNGAYGHLTNEEDERLLEWVLKFNQYDLYSKSDEIQVTDELLRYYKNIVDKYFPGKLNW
jgi:inositol oxygenase